MMFYEEPFLLATSHIYSPASLHTDVCIWFLHHVPTSGKLRQPF